MLVNLTRVTDGFVRSVQSAEEIQWSLVETLTGDSSLVASEAKLNVQFNPKAVAAYRLIGHEATAVGGLLPAAVESDLRVGQEATVLFEVWLYPNNEDDVAVVRLHWTAPDSGRCSTWRDPPRCAGFPSYTAVPVREDVPGSPWPEVGECSAPPE